jgi:hypothetical protein
LEGLKKDRYFTAPDGSKTLVSCQCSGSRKPKAQIKAEITIYVEEYCRVAANPSVRSTASELIQFLQ